MGNKVSGLTITFNPPVHINNRTIDEVVITTLLDDPGRKRVIAFCYNYRVTTLWEGAEYDSIGQWTDTDAINRLTEIITNS